MRLFSNFNTDLEATLVKKYKKNFWDDKILSIHKSRWFYITWVIWPFVLFFVVFSVLLSVVYMNEFDFKEVVIPTFWGVMLLYFVFVSRRSSKNYVDYKMDFLIVTPKELIKYDQRWMLDRHSETIHVDKIRSVTVSKSWLFNSFFDIGTITFLAEWNDEKWDIIMPFIDWVESIESKIRHIIWLDK